MFAKSIAKLVIDHSVNGYSIRKWLEIYQSQEVSDFNFKPHNAKYTKRFKQRMIEAFFAREGFMIDIVIKYKVFSAKTVRRWMVKYHNVKELKDYGLESEVYMEKCRFLNNLLRKTQVICYKF